MRTSAFILLFPFAVFITETARFIPAMKESCILAMAGKSACSKAMDKSPCSRKKEESTCSKTGKKDQCNNKKAAGNKDADNNCKDNPGCSTCPVCYTFIYQPQYEWHAMLFTAEKRYGLLDTGYLSFYTPNVWKPPNGFLYYS